MKQFSNDYPWRRAYQEGGAPVGATYHQAVRHEIVSLLPRAPRVLLDVGCAAGETAAKIREMYPGARAYGIELNANAAALAKGKLDQVFETPLEDLDADEAGIGWGNVDMVILADVLEHMVNPWGFLVALQRWLSKDAVLLVSLPNTGNLGVVHDLARGRWPYADQGLLDVTHLRFFTHHDAVRLFEETGYEVIDTRRTYDKRFDDNFIGVGDVDARLGSLHIGLLSDADAEDLRTFQFFFLVRPQGGTFEFNKGAVPLATEKEENVADGPPSSGAQSVIRSYHRWHLNRKLSPAQRGWVHEEMAGWGGTPAFHLGMIVLPGRERGLRDTVTALDAQLLSSWRLTVVLFEPVTADWLRDDRVELVVLGDDDDSLEVLNAVLLSSDADWYGLVECGDRLEETTLFCLAFRGRQQPGFRLIYTDEDHMDENGDLSEPKLKPDFNLEYLRSFSYIGGLCVYRRDLFLGVNGFDGYAEGLEELDMALKCFEHHGRQGIGHVARILYHRREGGGHTFCQPEEFHAMGEAILAGHFSRLGQVVEIHQGPTQGTYHFTFPLDREPRVSIIIPTRDGLNLLRPCIESLYGKTSYRNFQVIVVNNDSVDSRTLNYFAQIREQYGVTILDWSQSFNFAAMMNAAARVAEGEFLLLLNNDVEIIEADWLARMLRHGLRPGVGVVGAKLLFPNRRIQHAGAILGIGHQPAEHIFIGEEAGASGYMNRLQFNQEFSAVTAACMLISAQDYRAVGGMDELALAVSCNDVDLCLKVRTELNKQVIWVADARLIHIGSVSQVKEREDSEKRKLSTERFIRERETMFHRWKDLIGEDFAYNRNAALENRDFSLESEVPLTDWDRHWKPRPRVIAMPADQHGCGLYRIRTPAKALIDAGEIQGWVTERYYGPTELLRCRPDVIVVQRQIHDEHLDNLARLKRESDALLIFELDDLLYAFPDRSVIKTKFIEKESRASIEKALRTCDRLVTTNQFFADEFKDVIGDIRVVGNYLDLERWGRLTPRRRMGRLPRVGWAGGSTHAPDLELIEEVVWKLRHEVEWVFLGMCPEAIRQHVSEYHWGVPIDGYPAKLASLDLDLALAPLVDNLFNRTKSNLRLLEYGMLGYPVVCTDIEPYRDNFPVVRVPNDPDEWIDAIRAQIADRDALAVSGDRLRQHIVDNWILERNLERWKHAWLP